MWRVIAADPGLSCSLVSLTEAVCAPERSARKKPWYNSPYRSTESSPYRERAGALSDIRAETSPCLRMLGGAGGTHPGYPCFCLKDQQRVALGNPPGAEFKMTNIGHQHFFFHLDEQEIMGLLSASCQISALGTRIPC
ncbi:hypothetical protein XENTR_v10009346 [Xenopus tropicalis]|nr:hypothetical protein XENTR_v10009346 [Xenopus tropicalis]KAE8618293.1 hypothetical protein XENTR_v10009346 [Xenopus tropicalis]KAE8618294.1 hypothetical protein XENTR_v10009346 [Xenopus tropicalis]